MGTRRGTRAGWSSAVVVGLVALAASVGAAEPSCGDGVVDEGEACDDGNEINDGCALAVYPCEYCNAQCSAVVHRAGAPSGTCGDGVVDFVSEGCEPSLTGAGCGDDCQALAGWSCFSGYCHPTCGNGVVDEAAGEVCDLERDNYMPLHAELTMPTDGWYCAADCTEWREHDYDFCGDGEVVAGEACDDGPRNGATECRYGEGSCMICDASCAALTAATGPLCGDGILFPGSPWESASEECDDGPRNAAEGKNLCRLDCTLPLCGDGVVDDRFGEECDDAEANADDVPGACRTACMLPRCGDGVVDPGEDCDGADGCSSRCRLGPAVVKPHDTTATDASALDERVAAPEADQSPLADTSAPASGGACAVAAGAGAGARAALSGRLGGGSVALALLALFGVRRRRR